MNNIEIFIDGKYINPKSFTINLNLYEPLSEFVAEIDPKQIITIGNEFTIKIDSRVIYNSIIESVNVRYDKNTLVKSISGRNLLGLMAKEYIRIFNTFEGKNLSYIANFCIENTPYINKKCKIVFENKSDAYDVPESLVSPSPGETYFDFLKSACLARGVLFYINGKNEIVFTNPKTKITEKETYKFTNVNGVNNSIISADYIENHQNWYSKVIVQGQFDDNDSEDDYSDEFDDPSTKFNFLAQLTDDQGVLPIGRNNIDSTVIISKNKNAIPIQVARNYIEQQRFQGLQLEYKTTNFDQNGNLYELNKVAYVNDSIIGTIGNYLIYAMSISYQKDTGVSTTIRLSKLQSQKIPLIPLLRSSGFTIIVTQIVNLETTTYDHVLDEDLGTHTVSSGESFQVDWIRQQTNYVDIEINGVKQTEYGPLFYLLENIDQDYNVVVTFYQIHYTITVIEEDEDEIGNCPEAGKSYAVDRGDSFEVTWTVDGGNVYVNDIKYSNSPKVFSNIQSDLTIIVKFVKVYSIEVTQQGNNASNYVHSECLGGHEVEKYSDYTVDYSLIPSYFADAVIDGDSIELFGNGYTFNNIQSDHDIEITFSAAMIVEIINNSNDENTIPVSGINYVRKNKDFSIAYSNNLQISGVEVENKTCYVWGGKDLQSPLPFVNNLNPGNSVQLIGTIPSTTPIQINSGDTLNISYRNAAQYRIDDYYTWLGSGYIEIKLVNIHSDSSPVTIYGINENWVITFDIPN